LEARGEAFLKEGPSCWGESIKHHQAGQKKRIGQYNAKQKDCAPLGSEHGRAADVNDEDLRRIGGYREGTLKRSLPGSSGGRASMEPKMKSRVGSTFRTTKKWVREQLADSLRTGHRSGFGIYA